VHTYYVSIAISRRRPVATALARVVAHEARHQYILAHSAKGLGADSPRIWGDKNYEEFDGSDKANINNKINQLAVDWVMPPFTLNYVRKNGLPRSSE